MTGNLVFAGFLIADTPDLPLSASLFALAGTSGPRGQTGSGALRHDHEGHR